MTTREVTREEAVGLFGTPAVVGLTEEDERILSAPFPKEVIKSFTGKGGKEMRYIDVDVLEARVKKVDRNFERRVTPGTNSIAVHYVIKGVMRGDLYDNDEESNKYGRPQVNALARACRRALRLFGVGADLWEGDEEEAPAKENVREFKRPAQKSGSAGSSNGPSASQVSWLTTGTDDKPGLGVPTAVVKKLTPGRDGTASKLMDALFAARRENKDDYEEDPDPYIIRALKKIDRSLVPLMSAEEDDEDED